MDNKYISGKINKILLGDKVIGECLSYSLNTNPNEIAKYQKETVEFTGTCDINDNEVNEFLSYLQQTTDNIMVVNVYSKENEKREVRVHVLYDNGNITFYPIEDDDIQWIIDNVYNKGAPYYRKAYI